MVESGGLENRCTVWYRGFESYLLRFNGVFRAHPLQFIPGRWFTHWHIFTLKEVLYAMEGDQRNGRTDEIHRPVIVGREDGPIVP